MRLLALILAYASTVAWAFCEPLFPPGAPSTTHVAGDSLRKAYDRLPATGGVIELPYGQYGCEVAMWLAARVTKREYYKNFEVRGLPGPAGEWPSISCASGTMISWGPPMAEADGVTPAPTKRVYVQLSNLDIHGWTRVVNLFNVEGFKIHHVASDGRYDGTVVGGKHYVITERIGGGPDQYAHTEFCDSDIGGAGGGNQDHPAYTHCGPMIDAEHCSHAFVRSISRDPNGSIGVKTTAAGFVLVEDSTFYNACLAGGPCGTQNFNWVAATRRAVIRRNTFIFGDPSNPDANIPSSAMIQTSNRKYFPADFVGGGAFSPLYKPGYEDAEFHDPAWWAAAAAGGMSPDNPALRISVIHDNRFINYSNKRLPAILLLGTYPVTSDPYISDCLTPLAVPAGWFDLAVAAIGNNEFSGTWGAAGPIEARTNNYCGLFPTPPQETGPTIWDLGGNGPPGTAKVDLPSWVGTAE